MIVFGRDAAVEVPPVAATLAVPPRLESVLDPEYTDLASAVQRAQALFPPDAARRIVLVTDGNENRGNVYREARAAADAGVSIDVVPVRLAPRGDVAVEKIDMPAGVRRGQPFDVRIVLSHDAPAGDDAARCRHAASDSQGGRRRRGDRGRTGHRGRARPQVLTIREDDRPGRLLHVRGPLRSRRPRRRRLTQNNAGHRVHAHPRRRSRAADRELRRPAGEFDYLVERLRAQDIEVTTIDHRSAVQLAGRAAAVRRGDPGQRFAQRRRRWRRGRGVQR